MGPPGRGEEAAGLGTAVGSGWVAAGRVCWGGNVFGEGVSRGSLPRQGLALFPRLPGRGRPGWVGSLLWASSGGRKGLTGRMRVSGGLGSSSLPPPPPPRAFPAGVGDRSYAGNGVGQGREPQSPNSPDLRYSKAPSSWQGHLKPAFPGNLSSCWQGFSFSKLQYQRVIVIVIVIADGYTGRCMC